MDYGDRYEVEELIRQKTRNLRQQGHSFFDDYESDSIELWDAIEKLQNEVEDLKKQLKQRKEA